MEEESKVLDNYKVIEDCLCIRMPEEVDHHRSEEICKNADHFVLESQVANVVFDFEDTRFMDSSGIGIIIGRYKLISCLEESICASSGQADPENASAFRCGKNSGNHGMKKEITFCVCRKRQNGGK